MIKNEIIKGITDQLLKQRETLIYELCNLNYNEPSYVDKKFTIELRIGDLDMQVSNLVMNCEIEQP